MVSGYLAMGSTYLVGRFVAGVFEYLFVSKSKKCCCVWYQTLTRRLALLSDTDIRTLDTPDFFTKNIHQHLHISLWSPSQTQNQHTHSEKGKSRFSNSNIAGYVGFAETYLTWLFSPRAVMVVVSTCLPSIFDCL